MTSERTSVDPGGTDGPVAPGGRIVAAGGERVHVVESGPRDAPALLLSTGLGGAWFDWEPVIGLVGDRYRVIAFDRPGLGLSPAARRAASLRRDVDVLADLARMSGRPVTVVAHSMAGFHAEALARLHPELVRALVLVDPSCEERVNCAGLRISAAVHPVLRATGAGLEATRLSRVIGPFGRRVTLKQVTARDEPVSRDVVRSVYGRGAVLGTVLAEDVAYREAAADLLALRARRPLPDIPLEVLTALGDAGDGAEWSGCHRRLAGMSPRGHQVDLPDCPHMVQFDRPDAVADAVDRAHGATP
ncbi:alpha/beta fold hydrolase [Actinomadura rupiterrae]|uniref:alpha/beta fold hydrolase n=1 Tax=Actinomadura rupiterrae TaxID=559627 RepID=UPI0020A5FE1F|nr:alpha/beta hydrolase [Actinomadura rupiterrae]MCP2337074.1 pimeloyl-ACP methyl ester carboxylesterase [Actinomadura rupiterrae]